MFKTKLTGEKEEEDEHDGGVAEVEDHGGHAFHLQLGEVEVDRVDEEVERRAARRQVAPPPPPVVLFESNCYDLRVKIVLMFSPAVFLLIA